MPPPKFWKAHLSQISRIPRPCPGQRDARKNPKLASCPWSFTPTLIKVRNEERTNCGRSHSCVIRSRLCAGQSRHAAECFLRSDPRTLSGLQRRVCQVLESEDWAEG